MVYTDVPAGKEKEFNRWYNEEHIQNLMAMPGFLNAARYVAVSGGPKYLACYELESPEVINSPEHTRLLANPTVPFLEFWLKLMGHCPLTGRHAASILTPSKTKPLWGFTGVKEAPQSIGVYRPMPCKTKFGGRA